MQVVSVFFLFFLLAGCDGFGRLSDTEYVNRAQDYIDRGELNSAAIELKNALSQNPKNPQARWLLGKLYLDIGNMPSAEKELLRARELGVNEESTLPLLARAYLRQGKYEEAREQVVSLGLSNKAQASLLATRGLAWLGEREPDKAEESITAALNSDPKLPYAHYAQAMLDFSRSEFEAARGSLEQALKIDAGYAPGWTLLGDLERAENNPAAADQAYSKAIKSRFNPLDDRLKRALVRIQQKNFDGAQQDIDQLMEQAPKSPGVNYAQGLLHFLQQRYPQAQESFELALQGSENYMPAVFYLGATHYVLHNSEQSERYLSRFVNVNPGYLPARMLLAVQELAKRNYNRVEQLMHPVVASGTENVLAINLMANALLAQGKTEQGIRLLEQVVQLEPESAMAKARLGVGLLMEGEQTDAVANLEAAIEVDPKFEQADMVLVFNYLRQKKFDQAQGVAEDFLKRQPDSPLAHNLLGLAYLGQKRQEQAKAFFRKAIELAPGDPSASQSLAALALQDSKPDEARAIYEDVLKQHENNLAALISLAALEASQGDPGAMERMLERAMRAHPDAVQPRILLAQNYLKAGNAAMALEALGDLRQELLDKPAVMAVVGEARLLEQDFLGAKRVLLKLVKRLPNSAQAHFLLAKAYGGLNERKQVDEELSRSLELDPGYLVARLVKTQLQILDGDLTGAWKNVEKLKEENAENPDVMAVEAALTVKSGNVGAARDILEQRYQFSPNTKTLLDLMRVEWALGNQAIAMARVEKWVDEHRDDIDARMALANAYLAQGRQDEAARQYEQILEVSENNLLALNNIAWQLRKRAPKRARAYAEKAVSLAPESPVAMDTLAAILLEDGAVAQAQRLNEKTLAKDPKSPTFRFRKAAILEVLGKREQALKIISALLGEKQSFLERPEAEEMAKRLSRG